MRRTLLAVVGLGLLLGCVAVARAADADILRGKVVSVDKDKGTLVVKPKEGDNVTVTTDADTKVKVDGKDATLGDVKADMFVEIKPATGPAKTISARSLQAPEALRGKVVSVDKDKGTVVVKPKEGDNVTVATDADTKVKVDGKDATLGDVKADMLVEVKPLTGTAKTVNARSAQVLEILRGTVVSVDTDKGTVLVKPKEGENVTVTTNAETKVKVDGKDATLGDVKAGMMAEIRPPTGAAKTISAHTPKP